MTSASTFLPSLRKGLENVISGQSSSNSYLNRTEAAKKGKRFEKITLYVAILFGVLVIALYTITAIADNMEQTRIEESKAAAAASSAAGSTSTTVSSSISAYTSSATSSAASGVESEEVSEEVSEEATEETSEAAE